MIRNTRDELVAALKSLCDGLSPFQKMDSFDDYVEMHMSVYRTFGEDSFAVLIDILMNPPELGRFDPDDFEYALQEALTAVGRRNPGYALNKTSALLHMPSKRFVVINMIGGLKNENGLLLLEPLLEPLPEPLSEKELSALACALGDIGGAKAVGLLQKMKSAFGHRSSELSTDIEIGLNINRDRL